MELKDHGGKEKMSSNTDCILCGKEIGSQQVNLDMNSTIHPLLCRECLPGGKVAVVCLTEGVLITEWATYEKVRMDLINRRAVSREFLPSAPCNGEIQLLMPDHFDMFVEVLRDKYLDEPEFRRIMASIRDLEYEIEEARVEVDDLEWEIDTAEDDDDIIELEEELEELEDDLCIMESDRDALKRKIEGYPVKKIARTS